MAAPSVQYSFDRTANTEGRSVDSILWPMIIAKSQFLEMVKVGSKVNEPKVEWVSSNANTRTVTLTADGHADGLSSATGTIFAVSDAHAVKLQVGDLIRNSSIASPCGTYKADEIMKVVSIGTEGSDANHVTTVRGYNNDKTNGFNGHLATHVMEILFTPRLEGSSPLSNKYVPSTLSENYTTILDFYLTVTGTELARDPLIAADNMARQYDDRTTELRNQVASMVLYGALGTSGSLGGTTALVRSTKGLLQAMAAVGTLLDYTTTSVSETGINARFEAMFNAGVTPSSGNWAIVTNPKHFRTISAFGADKVRIERVDKTWGRYLTTYISDLGFEATIVPEVMCSKSNLFIVDMNKIELVPFRPWMQMEWGVDTSTPDGTDAYKQRVLGEYTMKVIDPLKSHSGFSLLSW